MKISKIILFYALIEIVCVQRLIPRFLRKIFQSSPKEDPNARFFIRPIAELPDNEKLDKRNVISF